MARSGALCFHQCRGARSKISRNFLEGGVQRRAQPRRVMWNPTKNTLFLSIAQAYWQAFVQSMHTATKTFRAMSLRCSQVPARGIRYSNRGTDCENPKDMESRWFYVAEHYMQKTCISTRLSQVKATPSLSSPSLFDALLSSVHRRRPTQY